MLTDQFLQFFHALPEAMCLLSGSGEILAVNPAMSRLLDRDINKIINKNLSEFTSSPAEKVEQYLLRCLKSKEMQPYSLQLHQASGVALDCACMGTMIEASADAVQSERCIMLRSTEKSQKTNPFAKLNSELATLQTLYHKVMDEKSVLEETVALRTADLVRHAKELERANKELDQFAYVASHDLKAPLRAISSLAGWIEEDIGEHFTPENHEQMDLLRGRVNRMEGLISGILQYSRIGRVQSEEVTVDIKVLLDEALDSLAPPPSFSIEIDANMPVFLTDRIRLFQVFSNLIGNAIKYHDRTDGHIRVSVSDKERFYEFLVADDGPGIAPQFHGKIFQIFQTLQPRDRVESTGVGLTLVKKIVEERGGNIRVESDLGKGATFIFLWPK